MVIFFQNEDARIIMTAMYENSAKTLLCEARGPVYACFLLTRYTLENVYTN